MRPDIDGVCSAACEHVKNYITCQQLLRQEKLPTLIILSDQSVDANRVYTRQKEKKCKELGIAYQLIDIQGMNGQSAYETAYEASSENRHAGIMLQLPAPGLNADEVERIQNAMSWYQDVDGLCRMNGVNRREAWNGQAEDLVLLPCTALGILKLLEHENVKIAGADAVIIGRSKIVGMPMADILMKKNATVTVCHSRTEDLAKHTKQADILIVAAGVPGLVTGDMVKPGAVVVDVGINRNADGKLVGDCDTESVERVAKWVTPVPGGAGRLTVASLMENVVKAHRLGRSMWMF